MKQLLIPILLALALLTGNQTTITAQTIHVNSNTRNDIPGNALAFAGANDYVNLGTVSPAGNFSSGFTFEAWAKWNSFNNWSRLLDLANGPASDNILVANSGTSNDLNFSIYAGTCGFACGSGINVPNALTAGVWTHIAVTVDNSGAAKLYINGAERGSGSLYIPRDIARTLCYLGKSNWGSDGSFDGEMDEVRIYNNVLDECQIADNMNQTINGNEPGLVAYYNFDQGVAGEDNTGIVTLPDITGNGYNGTLNNFALNGTVSNWVTSGAGAIIQSPDIIVSTTGSVNVLSTTADVNGNILNIGSGNASVRGVCYNTAGCPTTADSKVTETGSFAAGSFTVHLSGLTTGTTYYARAYAINLTGTSYGSEISFTNPCLVTIPDANFKNYLVGNLSINTNSDGEIQCTEAAAFTGQIDVRNKLITDMTGLEAFVNITSLKCTNNPLTGLNVSALTELTELECADDHLTSLNVATNTLLTQLICSGNQLTDIDVSNNTDLYLFYCENNQLTELDVSDLSGLKYFSCSDNYLTDVDVSANPALKYIYCFDNLLTGLNVKNGNNTIILGFIATSNPALTCIQVDDAAWSAARWANIGPGAHFSEDCDALGWSGAISNDWSNTGNWYGGVVPSSSHNVIITSLAPNMPLVNSSPLTPAGCNSLTIDAGATLTIAPEKALTANGTTVVNGSFIIESDATGTGSFIDNGSVTGNVTVKKYLSDHRWWYLGAPLSNATAAAFTTLSGVPDDGNRLFYWDEPGHDYVNVTNTTDAMPALKGYSFRSYDASPLTAVFTGTLNSGTIGSTDNLSYNSGAYAGFNLVSNPYPSAINWGSNATPTAGLTLTNLEPSVWYRNNSSFATYNYTSGVGANNAGKFVPAMQAFWVRVKDASGGGIQMTNAVRVHNAQAFYKTTDESNLFRMKVSDGIVNDETVIGFYLDAEDTFENFDSEKMFDNDIPQLYSVTSDSTEVAINGQSEFSSNEERIVSLGFFTNLAGTFTLNATNVGDFDPTVSVYLEDAQMNVLLDLRQTASYNFYSAVTNDINRFKLHFGIMLTSISAFSENDAFAYAVNSTVYVNTSKTSTVRIFDVLGNLILDQQTFQGLNKLQLNVGTGIYIVSIQTGTNITTQKIVISR